LLFFLISPYISHRKRKKNYSPLEGGVGLSRRSFSEGGPVSLKAEGVQGGVGWYYKLIVYKFLF